MNENIDLTKILKDCPKGTKLYSPILGDVMFERIDYDGKYPIIIKDKSEKADDWTPNIKFTKEGLFLDRINTECTLFPSKDQRDWSKFKAPWYKKEKFEPKRLKPFDRVICKNGLDKWHCDFFSSYRHEDICPYVCISGSYMYCIPYNDDTEYLVGTTEEAPKYYRYESN